MLCQKCYGSGRVMGQGMMYEECSCTYEDYNETISQPKPVQIDKRSKAYREAISRLMELNDLTREEAAKMFEEEFYKIA